MPQAIRPAVKLARSWTFRVVVIYVSLFGLSVLTLLGFIYITTVGFIDRQIVARQNRERIVDRDTQRVLGFLGNCRHDHERRRDPEHKSLRYTHHFASSVMTFLILRIISGKVVACGKFGGIDFDVLETRFNVTP